MDGNGNREEQTSWSSGPGLDVDRREYKVLYRANWLARPEFGMRWTALAYERW